MTLRPYLTLITLSAAVLAGGCAKDKPNEPVRTPLEECRYQVDEGYKELDRAKGNNPAAAGDVLRATGYLSAAAVQRQMDKYPECIEQAKHARDLLKPYVK